jgi:ABC-2 type transport system permease protein
MLEAPRASATVALLFRRELRGAAKSFLAWVLPTAGLIALTASMQKEMAERGSILEAKLAAMPEGLRAAMNISQLDVSDPVQFLAMNAMTWMLLGALFAGVLGGSLVAKEESFRTAEVLLSLPVRREAIVVGKALAGFVLVLAFDAVLLLAAYASYAAKGIRADGAALATMFAGAALVHVSLLAVALLASVALRRARTAMPLALGIVFGAWGIGVVSASGDRLAALAWLSPFKYADPPEVARMGLTAGAAVLPVLAVAASVAAVVLWSRKDIHA